MYCIECGAQIPENSKFCSHCGKQQNEGEPSVKEKIAEKIIETEIVRQAVEHHKKTIDYDFLRKTLGWYLAWVLLHLGFLLIGSDGIFDGSNMGSDDFWPFNYKSRLSYYDITEFLVYTIFPFAILVIYSMIRSQSENSEKESVN
jgi:zinc-ribbon domain